MSLTDDTQQHIQTRLDFSSPLTGEARGAEREETESFGATNELERPARTDRLMEEVCERDNLKEALRRVKANKGSAGVDGMTVGDHHGLLETALASHPKPSAERNLRAEAGEAGGNPQAGRRGAKAWHPDGAGSIYPAGGVAGAATQVGSDVLPTQLRVSTGTVGASRRGPGAAIYRRGLRLGGRPRSGEILRSSQPRQTDGPDCATGRRPAAAETHSGILECRGDGERAGQSKRGRDSARRTLSPLLAISCSTTSIGNWNAGDFALFAMRTTATSTSAANGRVTG